MTKTAILAGGLVLGMAAGAGASTFSDPYTSFWALGDSLTDDGNAFGYFPSEIPSPPYFMGRVSNGPTYAEGLAADFAAQGKPNDILAVAGAVAVDPAPVSTDLEVQAFSPFPIYRTDPTDSNEIPSLPGLAGRAAEFGARPLVSIFIGSNDVLNAIRDLPAGGDPIGAATAAATEIVDTIAALAPLVQDFLVFNLPDFAQIPRLNAAYTPPGDAPVPQVVRDLATGSALAFQATLDAELALLAAGIEVTQVDVFSAIGEVVGDPAAFGLQNATDPCLVFGEDSGGNDILLSACPDPAAFAFYDEIHPTSTLHAALEAAARDAVVAAPVPLPGAGWALLAGLGALGAVSARRRRAA